MNTRIVVLYVTYLNRMDFGAPTSANPARREADFLYSFWAGVGR
jgi:hypothetical protein